MQTSMGSGSGIGMVATLCVMLVIVLVCIHRAVVGASFFGDVFGGRHPSYPPCDLARQHYCRKDGCDLHDPKQQRHPGRALPLFRIGRLVALGHRGKYAGRNRAD